MPRNKLAELEKTARKLKVKLDEMQRTKRVRAPSAKAKASASQKISTKPAAKSSQKKPLPQTQLGKTKKTPPLPPTPTQVSDEDEEDGDEEEDEESDDEEEEDDEDGDEEEEEEEQQQNQQIVVQPPPPSMTKQAKKVAQAPNAAAAVAAANARAEAEEQELAREEAAKEARETKKAAGAAKKRDQFGIIEPLKKLLEVPFQQGVEKLAAQLQTKLEDQLAFSLSFDENELSAEQKGTLGGKFITMLLKKEPASFVDSMEHLSAIPFSLFGTSGSLARSVESDVPTKIWHLTADRKFDITPRKLGGDSYAFALIPPTRQKGFAFLENTKAFRDFSLKYGNSRDNAKATFYGERGLIVDGEEFKNIWVISDNKDGFVLNLVNEFIETGKSSHPIPGLINYAEQMNSTPISASKLPPHSSASTSTSTASSKREINFDDVLVPEVPRKKAKTKSKKIPVVDE